MNQTPPVKGERGVVARFTCHGTTLEVEQESLGLAFPPERPVDGLWWVRTDDSGGQ